MFRITGTLKKEEVQTFTRRNGEQGQKRILFIEPEGSIYPVKVSLPDMERKVGKEGDVVTLDVEVYPFYFDNGRRKRANVDFYVPNKQ